jgi:lipopolysaccharide heptosyltransferase I
MNVSPPRGGSRILIIKPSSPGDILHALPVARALRAARPDAHIAWLVATSFANLLQTESSIDELILFDRKRFAKVLRSVAVTRDFWTFLRSLKARRFDTVIDLQGLIRSGFMAWTCGATTRIGFRDAREFGWIFYNRRITARRADMHAVERNMAALFAMATPESTPDLRTTFDSDDDAAVDALLKSCGIDGPFAVLVPGTRWETKRWSPERFGELAARLRADFGLPALLVGGPDDAADAALAVGTSDGAAISVCGMTSLRQLAAVVARARVVVSSDSTPMHMAAAFDRPLVALFGPTSPDRTGPFGHGEAVLRLDLACSPCYLRRARDCPHALACMRDLAVDRVLEAVRSRLAGCASS